VRKPSTLAVLCFGAGACAAAASDLTVTSQLSQRVEANSNYQLASDPRGFTYAPVSLLSLDALRRTPTMRFRARGDLAYRTYFGPGAIELMDGLDKSARAEAEKREKLGSYSAAASWQQRQVSQVQLEEVGRRTLRQGSIDTTTLEGGLKRELSPWDALTLLGRWTSVEFTDPASAPFRKYSADGEWTHRLSRTADLLFPFNVQYLTFDNVTRTQELVGSLRGGVKARLSPRLSVRALVGFAVVNVEQGANALAGALGTRTTTTTVIDPVTGLLVLDSVLTPFNSPPLTSGTTADWVADLHADYKLDRVTELTFTAAQTVAPNSLGGIVKTDSAALVVRRGIDARSAVAFANSYSLLSASGETRSLFSSVASYSRRFTREWNAELAYRYMRRDDDTGSADSHSVWAVLRRDVTVLP
jgi:hypothetical protein